MRDIYLIFGQRTQFQYYNIEYKKAETADLKLCSTLFLALSLRTRSFCYFLFGSDTNPMGTIVLDILELRTTATSQPHGDQSDLYIKISLLHLQTKFMVLSSS